MDALIDSTDMVTIRPVLRCPHCHNPYAGPIAPSCARCGAAVPHVGDLPVLVGDPSELQHQLDAARRSTRSAWYTDEQAAAGRGPYRHHLAARRAYLEAAFARARASIPSDAIGLDLGCGDGENLELLRRHVDALYASDYNAARLLRAARLPVEATRFVADASAYPAVDDAFDVVLMNHVLEHIPDDAGALAEVHRIVRPGGTVILGVPNEGAAFWRLAYRLQPSVRASTDHVHFYTADSIAERCAAAGFEVRETTSLGWGVPHWSLDARLRRFRAMETFLTRVGRRIAPGQAASLYLVLGK